MTQNRTLLWINAAFIALMIFGAIRLSLMTGHAKLGPLLAATPSLLTVAVLRSKANSTVATFSVVLNLVLMFVCMAINVIVFSNPYGWDAVVEKTGPLFFYTALIALTALNIQAARSIAKYSKYPPQRIEPT